MHVRKRRLTNSAGFHANRCCSRGKKTQHTRVDINCQRNRVTLPVTLGQYEGNSGVLILWNLLIIGVTSVSPISAIFRYFPNSLDIHWTNNPRSKRLVTSHFVKKWNAPLAIIFAGLARGQRKLTFEQVQELCARFKLGADVFIPRTVAATA
jgi:hypothetical protein